MSEETRAVKKLGRALGTNLVRSESIPTGQVVSGCSCCLFHPPKKSEPFGLVSKCRLHAPGLKSGAALHFDVIALDMLLCVRAQNGWCRWDSRIRT